MKEHKTKKKSVQKAGTAENKSVKTDPMGSYTGRPAEKGEIPVQDADDL